MTMRTYQVTITGTQPLLLHHDDIEWPDRMEAWKNDKDNKKLSKAGDDRTPAFRWIGCLYRDENGDVILPTENVMRCLMEGGAMVLVPGGRRMGKSFMRESAALLEQARKSAKAMTPPRAVGQSNLRLHR